MRTFRSLKPEKLPEGFDAEIYGEKPLINIEESKNSIVISYTFPGFYLVDDSRDVNGKKLDFKQVNISSTGFVAESGKPLLPSFGRYVNIPPNCDYTFSVKKGKPIEFDDVLVLPAQEKLTDSTEERHVFEFDKELYAKDVLYPKDVAEVTGPFNIDEYNALLIHVRPFQYNPKKRKLIGYSNINVTVNLVQRQGDLDYRVGSPPTDREAFGNLFLNPNRKIIERLKIDPGSTRITPLKYPEFLIIYHDIFKDAAKKLAKWKNRRGLITETISINTIGNSVIQIKDYIRNRRKGFSLLRYVLLFGDIDMITPETISGGAWGDNVTDYYYSTEKDPIGTKDYVYPWLSIGRIPVRTAEEGMGIVDQIISYEKNPPIDQNYYQRMTVAAYFQDDNMDGTDDRGYLRTIEKIHEYVESLGYDVDRVYVTNNPNPVNYDNGVPIPATVKSAMVTAADATNMLVNATTEGRVIIGHRDHGNESGWVHPPFTTAHLDSVTGEMPTIFYSINCLTGKYDLLAPAECFAEKNLRMKGTAPTLIAATRVSHTWLNNDLIDALFDATFGGFLSTFPGGTISYSVRHCRLGDILNYAKTYLPINMSGSAEYIKDHYEIYHIVGDPSIELWKELPLLVNITAILTRNGLRIRLSSCPKGCVLTIWYGDTLLTRLEPSTTNITIPLSSTIHLVKPLLPLFKTPILVSFWAPGYRFAQIKAKLSL